MMGMTGCEGTGTDNPYGQGTVICVVDGVSYDLSSITSAQYAPSVEKMGVSGYEGTQIVSITFPGSSPGTWSSPGGGGSLSYGHSDGAFYQAGDFVGGSYTITVTTSGAVGERIEGTFSGAVVGSTGTRTISGSFSVERIPEQ